MIRPTRLEEDLARWEAGELTLEELERAHPDDEVGHLIDAHLRMTMSVEERVPDADDVWDRIERRIQPRSGFLGSLRLRLGRPVLVGFASALVTTSGAYALGFPPVERSVDYVRDRVATVLGDDERVNVRRAGGDDPARESDEHELERPDPDERNAPEPHHRDGGDGAEGRPGSAERHDARAERREERRERAQEAREEAAEAEADEREQREEAAEELAEHAEERAEEADDASEDAADEREDAAEEREDATDDREDAEDDD